MEALKDKSQISILGSLENIRRTAIKDGRPINVLQSDNGKEFRNAAVHNWAARFNIEQHCCEKDNKKCLGVAERFNRTIKFMIEMYLTKANSNRWINELEGNGYGSSTSVKFFP